MTLPLSWFLWRIPARNEAHAYSKGRTGESQGTALGVYGLGNIGQSATVFLGPVLAAALGWQSVFRGMSVLLVAWAVAFFLLARNSPNQQRPKTAGEMLAVLRRERGRYSPVITSLAH
jgi:MFS transporter, NNP family, nitrate/nitrite transporter